MIDQFKVFVFTIVFVFVILVFFVYIIICTCITYFLFICFCFYICTGCFLVIFRAKKIKNTLYSVQLHDEWMVKRNQHRQQETANTADCKICLKVKGEVVPENRAEIESSIRKSLNNVVAPDSVEVSKQHHAFFAYL